MPALCDINLDNLNRAIGVVREARGKEPAGYSQGPKDYQRLLQRDDVDAVLIATPMQLHGAMAVDSLRAGKHVLSEVAAAMTLDECWGIVRAQKDSGKVYMLAENCCYYAQNLVISDMVQQGVFGDRTYAACGYVHDCRELMFSADGSLTWRGEMARDYIGNLYPTHAIGPVAQWLRINRGDRFESLVAFTTPRGAITRHAARRFGAQSAAARTRFPGGDSTTTLIRTAKGAVIDLRYDISSARPHPSTTYYSLQGATASYDDDGVEQRVWIEGRSAKYEWEPLGNYAAEYEHPLWKSWREQASHSGHSGGDFFVVQQFIEAAQGRIPTPIDAADAATWSCVIPLSAASIRAGGAPQKVPDFTEGAWKTA
jgi:predicted dehydrogenase